MKRRRVLGPWRLLPSRVPAAGDTVIDAARPGGRAALRGLLERGAPVKAAQARGQDAALAATQARQRSIGALLRASGGRPKL